MKTLILTEKPSVAMDFAKALGVQDRRDGYIENQDYMITWAVGHLLELCEPDDYDEKWKKWNLETLPILPDSFRYKPIAQTKKQYAVVCRLLKNPSLDRVVIATDAGREGEVIARTILLSVNFRNEKILFRFWSSLALTPQVIREGMASFKTLSEYDRLWKAGQSRQIADWLVGMNITRAATVSLRDLYSVGRVQTAVLALLVDRRREIDSFIPVPYWLLLAHFSNEKGKWWGTWFRNKQTRFDKKAEAEVILARILHQPGIVVSVNKQKKKQPPPFLYSLTDLQQDANKKFGLSAQETLNVAQTLYEKLKCLSYPRTDANVLGEKNVDMAKDLVDKLTRSYPPLFSGIDQRLIHSSNKRVFNDAKLTDHHALIPLTPLPGGAKDEERKIYDLVLKRFAAAFHPDCEYEQTEIITEVEKETFRSKGKVILKPGWRAVYGVEADVPESQEDEVNQENLPSLSKDDPAVADEMEIKEKKTTPPPEYTEALLLKDMTHPGKYVSEDDLKKIFRGDVGLGTQATRAQIIETLLKRQYVQRRKKILLVLEKGCFLIDTLRRFSVVSKITSAGETARWEMQLHQIAQGQGDGDRFLSDIRNFILEAVQEMKTSPSPKPIAKSSTTPIAKPETQPIKPGTSTVDSVFCPACGGKIIEGKRGYGCSNWKPELGGCTFVVWKEIAGKSISFSLVQQLVSSKKIGPLPGLITEENQSCSGYLLLTQIDGIWKVDMEPVKEPVAESSAIPSEPKVFGICPDCGGQIVEGKKAYGCSNWRESDGGCRFVIWKIIAKKRIPKKAVSQLLEAGKTEVLQGFQSKEGKKFAARLKRVKQDQAPSKVVFEFD